MSSTIVIKTVEEIASIRSAGRLLAQVHEALREEVRPGITTGELNRIADRLIRDGGGIPTSYNYGDPPFPASICTSIDDEVVHGIPADERVLEEGQIITLDITVGLEGWQADAARTWPVGEISEEKRKLIVAAETAFNAGLAEALEGQRVGDIAHAVQRSAEGEGYGVIRELCGHGIGREMHEAPEVPNYGRPGRGPRLRSGMVFCIEPMITAGKRHIALKDDEWTIVTQDGRPAAHYENTIAITPTGPEILTLL